MEKSTDVVDTHPLTRLVHQGFGVLWGNHIAIDGFSAEKA